MRESCPEAATSRFDASPHHLRRHLRGDILFTFVTVYLSVFLSHFLIVYQFLVK